MHHLAREVIEPFDHRLARPVEAPTRDHDAVEALAASVAGDDSPASVIALDASDRCLQPNRLIKIERLGIGAEIVAELLEARKHGHRLGGREVRERVQRLAGVGAHPGQTPLWANGACHWPPAPSACSKTTGSRPSSWSDLAAARPLGPAPTTATRRLL